MYVVGITLNAYGNAYTITYYVLMYYLVLGILNMTVLCPTVIVKKLKNYVQTLPPPKKNDNYFALIILLSTVFVLHVRMYMQWARHKVLPTPSLGKKLKTPPKLPLPHSLSH